MPSLPDVPYATGSRVRAERFPDSAQVAVRLFVGGPGPAEALTGKEATTSIAMIAPLVQRQNDRLQPG